MSTRSHIPAYKVFTDANMNSSLTSSVSIINFVTGVGYDLSWTGTPVGTFSVEISNTYSLDAAGNVKNAGNWTPVDLSGPIVATGSPDNAFINMAGLEAYAIRLVYTRTSGVGTLNATVVGKVQ